MLGLAAGAALGGCSGIIGPVPMQLYRLDPPESPAPGPEVRWRLAVAVPDAAQALDTDRIALDRGPSRFDYFAGAAWTDRAPALIQGLLIRRFAQSGRIFAVSRDTDSLRVDYLLRTELRAFEAGYASEGAPPEVAVEIAATLIHMPLRDVAQTTLVRHAALAARNDLEAVVQAFAAATGQSLDALVLWALAAPPPGTA